MKAHRPSATAQVVAGSLLCLAHDGRDAHLLPNDPLHWREHVLAGSASARALRAKFSHSMTMPGTCGCGFLTRWKPSSSPRLVHGTQ